MHTDLHLVISTCIFLNREHSLLLFHHQCLVQFSSSKQQNVNYLSLLLTSRKLGFILPVGFKTKRWRRERRQTYGGRCSVPFSSMARTLFRGRGSSEIVSLPAISASLSCSPQLFLYLPFLTANVSNVATSLSSQ